MQSLGQLIKNYQQEDKDKYLSREWQKYGYDLAQALGDMKHKALYIKLAKTTPRGWLETAKSFAIDAENARSKGRLFMWKLTQIKKNPKKAN